MLGTNARRSSVWGWVTEQVSAARVVQLGLLCVLGLQVGCECSPRSYPFTYSVVMDDNLRLPNGQFPTIEVDLVGVNEAEKDVFEGLSVNEYFAPNNRQRANAKKQTVTLSTSSTGPFELEKNAPFWDDWIGRRGRDSGSGATNVFIFANMARPSGSSGGPDTRKESLPLNGCRWDNKNQPIEIRVTETGLKIEPGPKAPGG